MTLIGSNKKVPMHSMTFVYASDLVRAVSRDTRMYQEVLRKCLDRCALQYMSNADFANVLESELLAVQFSTSWNVLMKMIGQDNWVCTR